MKERYSRNEDFVYRKIGQETILVPIRREIQRLYSIYTLNQTACRVWELLKDRKTYDEIVEAFLKEYAVEQVECEQDLKICLDQLQSIGAVTVR